MSKGNNPSRATLDMRRREAQERQEAYDRLSTDEKIARLDARFGKGLGAKRQRERLLHPPVQTIAQPKKAPQAATSKDPKRQETDAKAYLGGKTIEDVRKAREGQ